MPESKINEVAKLLGIELEEEFNIEGFPSKFKLTLDGLMGWSDYNQSWFQSSMLEKLLLGQCRIIKPVLNDDEKEYARMKITSLAIGNASLDDEETVEELLASGHLVDTHDYAEEVLNTISKEELEQMLDTLTPREAEVLRLRFGFYDNTPKTRVEIAKIFGLSYDIIRGIEERAIKKLRHPSKTRIIRNYYNDSETEKYGKYDGRHK